MSLAVKLGRYRISEIDLTFADKFKAQHAQTLAPKSLFDEMMLLRQLCKFAHTRRMVDKDPLLGLKLKKPKPTPQPCFDDEQIAQILALARPPQAATFLLLAETGFRIGEAKWLTWPDVDFKANVLYVRPKDGWKPKSGDVRTVPISPRLAQLLREREHLERTRLFGVGHVFRPCNSVGTESQPTASIRGRIGGRVGGLAR